MCTLAFNSLFEMLIYFVEKDGEVTPEAFNSLFEMHVAIWVESRLDILEPFNSLFEMQLNTTAAPRCTTRQRAFNSLFEMLLITTDDDFLIITNFQFSI